MTLKINGNTTMPTPFGGYLIINLDGKEFHITSVPSPVVNHLPYQNIVVENSDIVADSEGNEFDINVYSSSLGLDWQIEIKPANPQVTMDEFKKRMDIEFLPSWY